MTKQTINIQQCETGLPNRFAQACGMHEAGMYLKCGPHCCAIVVLIFIVYRQASSSALGKDSGMQPLACCPERHMRWAWAGPDSCLSKHMVCAQLQCRCTSRPTVKNGHLIRLEISQDLHHMHITLGAMAVTVQQQLHPWLSDHIPAVVLAVMSAYGNI